MATVLTASFASVATVAAQDVFKPKHIQVLDQATSSDDKSAPKSQFGKVLINVLPIIKEDLNKNKEFWSSLTPEQYKIASNLEFWELNTILKSNFKNRLDGESSDEIAQKLGIPQKAGFIKILINRFDQSIDKYKQIQDYGDVVLLYSTLSPERQKIYEKVFSTMANLTTIDDKNRVIKYVNLSLDNAIALMQLHKDGNEEDLSFYMQAIKLSNHMILKTYIQNNPDIDNYNIESMNLTCVDDDDGKVIEV